MSQRPEAAALHRSERWLSHAPVVRVEVQRWRGGQLQQSSDYVADEVPVALLYNGSAHAVMLASPLDLEDFALGFSLTEGILNDASELEALEVQHQPEGIELRMQIPDARMEALRGRERSIAGRSGCGLCGVRALEAAVRRPAAVGPGVRVGPEVVHAALQELATLQPLNAKTGAVHAAAWARIDGSIAMLKEDIGRHNALDKLIGGLARTGTAVDEGFVVVTSRASYEMVQKSAGFGVSLMAAISAPTGLAIQLAISCGMTLIGFARRDSHVVYSHPQRLLTSEPVTRNEAPAPY